MLRDDLLVGFGALCPGVRLTAHTATRGYKPPLPTYQTPLPEAEPALPNALPPAQDRLSTQTQVVVHHFETGR